MRRPSALLDQAGLVIVDEQRPGPFNTLAQVFGAQAGELLAGVVE